MHVKSPFDLIIKTNCPFPFATNVSRVLLISVTSCLPSEAELLSGITCLCVCLCVSIPWHDTRQSVILAKRNEAWRQEDGEAGSLLVLSIWADDLGPLYASKQSALMLGSWPNKVFLQLAPWWVGLEVRHNFAFPASDGSDCSPFIKTVREPSGPSEHSLKHNTP